MLLSYLVDDVFLTDELTTEEKRSMMKSLVAADWKHGLFLTPNLELKIEEHDELIGIYTTGVPGKGTHQKIEFKNSDFIIKEYASFIRTGTKTKKSR